MTGVPVFFKLRVLTAGFIGQLGSILHANDINASQRN